MADVRGLPLLFVKYDYLVMYAVGVDAGCAVGLNRHEHALWSRP